MVVFGNVQLISAFVCRQQTQQNQRLARVFHLETFLLDRLDPKVWSQAGSWKEI